MRICFLAGVVSIHTTRWVSWFARRGHDVHVISPESIFSKDKTEVEGATIHRLKTLPKVTQQSHLLAQPVDYWRVKSVLKRINPQIVNGHYLVDYGFRAAFSGFHPLVLTAWGSDVLVTPRESPISRWEVKFALKRADLVTCDADHMVEQLVHLGTVREKIELIRFGIDTQKFQPQPKSAKLKEQLGIFDSPIVISLRSLRPIYNVESLIKAIPLVLKEIPAAIFIIAGNGDQVEYLNNLAKSLGIYQNVRFIGFVKNDKLPQYLTLADVYVSTSLSDAGLAASTAEAMACGLPVVITDFGDNRNWVEDGVNGFLVPMRNPETLAAKIVYLLQNQDKRTEFGQANRRLIEDKCNGEKEMRKMENLYKELIERYKK